MASKALDTYLNDHLGGARAGTALAAYIRDRAVGTPLGDLFDRLADEIEEDRRRLLALMAELGTHRNQLKEASALAAERVGRLKFAGVTSGGPEVGLMMALEALLLGVRGKLALWTALSEIADAHPALARAGLEELIERARGQQDAIDEQRTALAGRVLAES